MVFRIFTPAVVMAAILVFAVAAPAQALEEPRGASGAIVSTAADAVTLKQKDGTVVTVAMVPGWTVVENRPVGHDALKPDSFIGSANTPIDDHTGRSVEMRIFEPGNEPEHGTHGMGNSANLMTHGTVSKVVTTDAGTELDITYPDGGRHLILPSGVQVIESFVVDPRRAQPGVMVGAVTRKGADGVWRATRLALARQSQ